MLYRRTMCPRNVPAPTYSFQELEFLFTKIPFVPIWVAQEDQEVGAAGP